MMEDLFQGINTPATRETDHTPIVVPGIGDITADYSPTPILTVTEAGALEGTPCALLPATTAVHATPQPMDAPITPHATIPTGIVTPHPALTIPPTSATHATPQTRATLIPAAPTTQHKFLSPGRLSNAQRPSTPHKPHCPKTVTIQDSSSDS